MEELHKFMFGTVVCDGCAHRIDSRTAHYERLHDIDDLLEFKLEDLGWEKKEKDKWFCPECVKNETHRTHPGEGRVIVERMTLSGIRCDHCGKSFENYEGYSMWAEESDTMEHAHDDNWQEIGGKMLCPDCYRSCDAVENIDIDNQDEDWEKKYCTKCPHKDNCDEIVEREVPETSTECDAAVRKHYELSGIKYERCPYLSPNEVKGLREVCNLPEGKKCPRVEAWEIDKERVKENNKKIQEWVKTPSAPLKP